MNEELKKEELRNELINSKPFDKKKPYIFISYCHKDYEKVWKDVIILKRMGLNIWIDCENFDGWRTFDKDNWKKK